MTTTDAPARTPASGKKIATLLRQGTTVSFEFFPPRTELGRANLRRAVKELAGTHPDFVSVTYGAAGSTRDRTRDVVIDIERDTDLTPMPHLTCIGHSRAEIADILGGYADEGLCNVLALHGDAPTDQPDLPAGDFRWASDLVDFAREIGDFSVGVATHPEGHPKAPDHEIDRRHQAAKLARADFGITQFFFRVEDYLRLVDDVAAHGVDTPIIAGVMPITDPTKVERFAEMSGAEVPREVTDRFDGVTDPDEVQRIGVAIATELTAELLDQGVPGLHFYTLNRAAAAREVLANLQLDGPRRP